MENIYGISNMLRQTKDANLTMGFLFNSSKCKYIYLDGNHI